MAHAGFETGGELRGTNCCTKHHTKDRCRRHLLGAGVAVCNNSQNLDSIFSMPTQIRSARAEDAASVAQIYQPLVLDSVISFELEVPSVEEMRRRIVATTARLPWLVCVDSQAVVEGYVYASRHRERAAYQWSVDVTAYVRAGCRGRGIGKTLYLRLFEELRALGYCQAFAGITLPNAASVALHESLGFKPIGVYRNVGYKLGAWHDVGWWQATLQLPDPPPVLQSFDGRESSS
jgi:phosphinothricin acetyltransferase